MLLAPGHPVEQATTAKQAEQAKYLDSTNSWFNKFLQSHSLVKKFFSFERLRLLNKTKLPTLKLRKPQCLSMTIFDLVNQINYEKFFIFFDSLF